MTEFLITIGVIAGIYILGLFIVFFLFLAFANRINKRTVAIDLLWIRKIDILLDAFDEFKDNSNIISDLKKLKRSQENIKVNLKNKTIISLENRSNVETIQKNLFACKLLGSDQESTIYSVLQEIEEDFRRSAAIYNSDLQGYNYWVRYFLYRYMFLLFKKGPKEKII